MLPHDRCLRGGRRAEPAPDPGQPSGWRVQRRRARDPPGAAATGGVQAPQGVARGGLRGEPRGRPAPALPARPPGVRRARDLAQPLPRVLAAEPRLASARARPRGRGAAVTELNPIHAEAVDDARWAVVLTRQLRQGPERVWRMLTDPERLGRWTPYTA